jgi:L-fucose mutarotase
MKRFLKEDANHLRRDLQTAAKREKELSIMLIGISPLISPELLATLHRMGHGDEIVLADAHFPGHRLGPPVIRADGLPIDQLLDAILPLIALDSYVDAPLAMMEVVEGDTPDLAVEVAYRRSMDPHLGTQPKIERLDRQAFYDRARRAFSLVMTGETRTYGNLLIKKGVTPLVAGATQIDPPKSPTP